MGMSMIDAIFEKGQETKGKGVDTGDWSEVLKVLSAGKVRAHSLHASPFLIIPLAGHTAPAEIFCILITSDTATNARPCRVCGPCDCLFT